MKDSQHNEAYIITDSDETIGRLIYSSELQAANVRDGFLRTDLGLGGKVIDVGCGPVGALLVLSDLVGPEGTVVGMDMDQTSLQRARAILDREGKDGVQLVQANINADPTAELLELGPFDAAYCRLFLQHQPDPAATLRRMAGLLRPGGYVVAHEFLIGAMPPRSEPELPELDQVWRWFHEASVRRGSSPDVAARFHSTCRQAGLIEVSQRLFGTVGARDGGRHVQAWRETLLGIRHSLLQHGVATQRAIEIVVNRLAEAERWEFEVVFMSLFVELVARVPLAG
jgi:SAM-dependent methyltransferase